MDLESMAAGGGIVGVVVGAAVKIFGSRPERDASTQAAADEWQELHRECKGEVSALRDRLDAQDKRLQELERVSLEHVTCGPRIAQLESEQAIARQMLGDLMRNASTPPPSYTGDDVRAALEESNG